MQQFFDRKALDALLRQLQEMSAERGMLLHFVSARELVNIVHALEADLAGYVPDWRDFRYISCLT